MNYWINKKKTIITFIFLIIAGSVALFMYTTKELLPKEDRGVYLVIGFTDEGSSFDYTQQRAQDVERDCFHCYRLKIVPTVDLS